MDAEGGAAKVEETGSVRERLPKGGAEGKSSPLSTEGARAREVRGVTWRLGGIEKGEKTPDLRVYATHWKLKKGD